MKVFIPLLFGAVLLAGCGDKAADADAPAVTTGSDVAVTTGSAPPPVASGVAGTYEVKAPDGTKMTLKLGDDMKFEMSGGGGNGNGTYTHDSGKVTMTVSVIDGKPASEEHKKRPMVLNVNADGNLSAGPSGAVFVKK